MFKMRATENQIRFNTYIHNVHIIIRLYRHTIHTYRQTYLNKDNLIVLPFTL